MSSDGEPNWELRLIVVEWANKQRFKVAAEAESVVQLTRETAGLWTASIPTFPRVGHSHAQLAICGAVVPVLILSDGSVRPFKQLDGTKWWIEKYKFVGAKDGGPYWKSTLNAKAGHADIRIGEETIKLTLLPSDWSWDQITGLEEDLRRSALKLLADSKSSAYFNVPQERRKTGFDQVRELADQLRTAADQILRNPITALAPSVRLVQRHKAPPCAAGIMDATCRPGVRFVRARVAEETVDVPENRYLVYLLQRARRLLQLLHSSIDDEAKAERKEWEALKAEIPAMPASAPNKVPAATDDLHREKQVLKEHLARIERWDEGDRKFYERWVSHRPDVSSPRSYVKKMVENGLAKLEHGGTWLATDDEYFKRLSALNLQKDLCSRTVSELEQRAEQFGLLDQSLAYGARRWRALGVSPSNMVPASIAIHRHPAYVRAISAYRELMRFFGSQDTADLFLRPLDGDAFGVVDLWLLFERWCLLQLINAVCRFFDVTDTDFRERIQRAALAPREGRSENEVFHFARQELICTVELEPELRTIAGKAPKRPDFRIKIRGGTNEVVAILDAKCQHYRRADDQSLACSFRSLSDEIKAMCLGPNDGGERNYSMDGRNTVFVLHPSRNAVPKSKGGQKWSEDTYYGERAIYEWQSFSPNHRYGAVCMRPGHSRDLQRLLALLVHAALLPQSAGVIAADVQHLVPCATCGGALKWEEAKPTPGGLPTYRATCTKCKEYHVFTHCFLCGQRLIKAGRHATYHSLAGQIGNIRCPSCETAL